MKANRLATLKIALMRARLTQEVLASHLGVTGAQLSRFIHGHARLKKEQEALFFQIIGVDPKEVENE